MHVNFIKISFPKQYEIIKSKSHLLIVKFWWSVKRSMRKLLAGFIETALGKTKRRERNTH